MMIPSLLIPSSPYSDKAPIHYLLPHVKLRKADANSIIRSALPIKGLRLWEVK